MEADVGLHKRQWLVELVFPQPRSKGGNHARGEVQRRGRGTYRFVSVPQYHHVQGVKCQVMKMMTLQLDINFDKRELKKRKGSGHIETSLIWARDQDQTNYQERSQKMKKGTRRRCQVLWREDEDVMDLSGGECYMLPK
ncbi:hypothetical protein L1987_05156 [Smallanthus sonchifolius]|uniref:Uncharacterized protein n=1 Tax=Smallanthus sonchifolius TaxID=185202 RepID=A0ACB9JUK4_9ASTR|nr:hypothetical protein L1987_05156 [Smallanthus sonchifolius]